MRGKIAAVCISQHKGEKKVNVGKARLIVGQGLEGDAHAGYMHRQVSLLALESIRRVQNQGVAVDIGDYAENLTVEGINLPALPIGTILKIGEVTLKVSQIGKECHAHCKIFEQVGDCIMPKEGIFATVEEGGIVTAGDVVEVIADV